jgi:glutamine---fructose-6-phosphate transaminase (isomerizing)
MSRASVDRVAALIEDIEAIPALLERLAEPRTVEAIRAALVAALGARTSPTAITLTGFGSSRFAALQAESAFRSTGLPVLVAPAADDDPQVRSGDVLTVAISSGGRTGEVVAAAARARRWGPTLAITRDADSPLGQAAAAVLALDVEPESSGIAITSFVATIAVLLELAAELGGAPRPDLATSGSAARATLAGRDSWLPAALATCAAEEEVAVLAPWPLRGVAEQAALLFREAPRRTASAFETAEWLHVGVYTALPGSVLLRIPGSPADAEVDRTVEGRSGRVIDLPAHASDPIAGIAAPALLAAAWWRALSSDTSEPSDTPGGSRVDN